MSRVRKATYYEILGIDRNSSVEQIRSQFQDLHRFWSQMARANASQAEAQILEITRAFSVLSDPEERQKYDLSLDFEFVLLDGKTKDPDMEEAYDVYRSTHKKTYQEILNEFSFFKDELGDTLWLLKTTTVYLVLSLLVYSLLVLSISFLPESWVEKNAKWRNYLIPVYIVVSALGYLCLRKFFLNPKLRKRKESRKLN
ncbi:DnaJ domain-containing protein [Leptospira idonii]|uniref:Molecular chaperone DnaJ n=1 Tax=Leptospira idonii TaxID=1193500 RepID=A0A4R9LYI4_9LEPT|nr:DnaJ domain-containing protein [Leptospira idonii]TGN18671.1 molecular chaperone DnaJ [Leptospira idonii]